MNFRVEHGDNLFILFAPDGEYESPVHYCTFSTMEYQGKVYGIYLSGETNDDDVPIDANGNIATVYDITDFPKMVPVPTTFEEVVFDAEANKKGVSKDGLREVECPKCDGDGFYFEKIPGWVAPPPEDDEEEEEEIDTIDVEPIA